MALKLTYLCFAGVLAAAALGGRSFAGPSSPAPVTTTTDSPNRELLNNTASLLDDLLKNEKNLNKILIIKSHSEELKALVEAIARTAAEGEGQLQVLARSQGLNLKALELPPGERAARKAMAKTKEHELLLSFGNNFAFYLLLTQADALSYGSHLAKIVAENLPHGESARQFHSLARTLNGLLKQVNAQIRSLPSSPRN